MDRGGAQAREERDETEAERIDRNLTELLQELRVAAIGVQVLFGFLLALPFTNRFTQLGGYRRGIYVADLVVTAIAAALFSMPVAYHRIVFRQHKKAGLLRVANVAAILGLGAVLLAVSGAVFLAVSVVYAGSLAPIIAGVVAAAFLSMWFVMPKFDRRDDY
jgi:O-antigen/teichoic acid export membrane protein